MSRCLHFFVGSESVIHAVDSIAFSIALLQKMRWSTIVLASARLWKYLIDLFLQRMGVKRLNDVFADPGLGAGNRSIRVITAIFQSDRRTILRIDDTSATTKTSVFDWNRSPGGSQSEKMRANFCYGKDCLGKLWHRIKASRYSMPKQSETVAQS